MKRFFTQGFASLEVMVTLIVVIGLLSVGATWIERENNAKLNHSAAAHATVIKEATAKFIKENRATVLAAAAPSVTYTTANIAAYLPTNFVTVSPYGQTYSIRVHKPSANILEVMIVTMGGDVISDRNLREIAQLIGGAGGYVSVSDTTRAQGAFGGWNMPFTNYGASPGAGRVAVSLFYDDSATAATGDYLYRNAVAGHPEYNQMNTALNMNTFNITNAGQINAGKVQVNDVVGEGTGCSSNGLTARNTAGLPLTCQSGVWRQAVGRMPGGTTVNTSGRMHIQADETLYLQPWASTGGTVVGDGGGNGQLYQYGRNSVQTEDWAYVARSGAGADNAAPTSGVGSAYLNDAYFRSIGKWASQMGGEQQYSIGWSVSLCGGCVAGISPNWWVGGTPKHIYAAFNSANYYSQAGGIYARWWGPSGLIRDWTMMQGSNINGGPDGGSGMVYASAATLPMLNGATYVEFMGAGSHGGTVNVYGIGMQ